MYIHLTAHSAYSLQEGLLLPAELAEAARANGMPALGLTDHRLLSGAVEFVLACKAAGVQPLLGLEIDLDSGRLALLATSMAGWSNLCRLSSALALADNPSVPCPLDLLAWYTKDLIALPDGDTDEAQLGRLKELFPDALYITLQNPARGLAMTKLAAKLGLPLVVTHPVYYLTPEQATLQRTLAAMRLIRPLDQLPSEAFAPDGAYFTSAQEMQARFDHFPVALAATQEIAARCKFDLPLGVANMPTVPLPPGQTAAQYLRAKAEAGARRIYGRLTAQIRSRLDHELEVISRMGFEPIFLIVEEVLNFARETDVPFSSRGSAASSLVAHCLGITSPDPLRLNLYFERFLNPARTSPPDIDTDLCSRRRDSVIRHVFETYGPERVAMVATINHFRPRSALGEAAKAHGLEPAQVREMVNQLPYAFWVRREEGEEGADPPSAFVELRGLYTSSKYRRILDEAEDLLKLPRHLSVHPRGLIVAPSAVTDLVPVMRSGNIGFTITQLDLKYVEALNLIKNDLLLILSLHVPSHVADIINASMPAQYASPLGVLDSTPAGDPQTAQRVENGQTIGCFQIESPGMRATLREIHARSEDDIMAGLERYRPGPLTVDLQEGFVS